MRRGSTKGKSSPTAAGPITLDVNISPGCVHICLRVRSLPSLPSASSTLVLFGFTGERVADWVERCQPRGKPGLPRLLCGRRPACLNAVAAYRPVRVWTGNGLGTTGYCLLCISDGCCHGIAPLFSCRDLISHLLDLAQDGHLGEDWDAGFSWIRS